MTEYKYHELSHYFPMLPEDEFDALKDSISKFGLLEPITLFEGQILDGRNRYEACQALGLSPRFREYQNGECPAIDFVVAHNMRRRHLSPEQKSQIIMTIEGPPMAQRHGGTSSFSRNSVTVASLADKAGVSEATIRRVAEVQDMPDLVAKLRAGEMTATEAVRERMQRVADQAKIAPTWQGLYAKAPYAVEITKALGAVIHGVDRWLGNQYGLDKIDPKGHTPLLIKRTDEAIGTLKRFKKALEELQNG